MKISLISIFLTVIFCTAVEVQAFSSDSNDPYLKYQNYLDKISIFNMGEKYTGKNVVVAVLDSGIQQNNPDLKSALWKNFDEIPSNGLDDDKNGYVDDYYGYNFVAGNSNMNVYDSHGTGVASIIAAQRDNNYGIFGIAPGVKIMVLTVCSNVGCKKENVRNAIRYATDNGANILNMSLGSSGSLGYDELDSEAIVYAYKKGVLLVAAAGNNDPEGVSYGKDLNVMKQSPVCNESDLNIVLGVGATSGDMDIPAGWSSYGDKYVDVWAPGEKIATLSVEGFTDLDALYQDGTSFSAPIISAVAAMIKEKNPKFTNTDLMSQILSYSDYNTNGNFRFINVKSVLDGDIKKTSIDRIEFDGIKTISIYGKYFFHDVEFSIENNLVLGKIPSDAIQVLATNKVVIDLSKIPFLKISDEPYTVRLENVNGEFGGKKEEKVLINKMSNVITNDIAIPPPPPFSESSSPVLFVVTELRNVFTRIKPTTKEKTMGVLKRGVLYPVIDSNNKNWIKIKYKKEQVWISRVYVKMFSVDLDI